MKTNWKAGVSAFAGICLSAAMLGGCVAQAPAPGKTGTGYSTTGTAQNQAYNRNNLMSATTQYSLTNLLGTNPANPNPANRNNLTGYNYMTGTGYGYNPGYSTTGYSTTGTNNLKGAGTNLTGTIPNTGRTNLTGYGTTQRTPNRSKADAIKRQVLAMKGVRSCDATVIGNTALVGIKTAPHTNNTALKHNISTMVKKMDTTISNCAVKDSSNIVSRIKSLNASISRNRPIGAITTEFDRLLRGA